ncbi:hypothetical protein EV648_109151 [Kribbella sp. VKM Ac-2568]|nr:hypothetical protein EV648_109151 [Kribbella sp. VKM Ac-2568]
MTLALRATSGPPARVVLQSDCAGTVIHPLEMT